MSELSMVIGQILRAGDDFVRPDLAATPARHFPGPDGLIEVPEGNVLDYWTADGVLLSADGDGRIHVPPGHTVVHSRVRGEGPPPDVVRQWR